MSLQEAAATPDGDRPALAAFNARDDLAVYGTNALLLFAAQLRLAIEDVDTFAANCLTDSSNDKSCDLVAVHDEILIVAQGYYSNREDREAAPSSKASDLNSAVSWLLSGDVDSLPDVLQSAAIEAREALALGAVRELQIWYVHNLPESKNVRDELTQAAHTADSLLRREFASSDVDVSVHEIGRSTLEEDYKRIEAPILVSDRIDFDIPGGFEIDGGKWSAYSTAISATQLRNLWLSHKKDLMSPNIRDYLGLVRSESNINYGIKQTLIAEPANFAIFNNGITVLVHDFEVFPNADGNGAVLTATGVGIVNGGQTTGAIGELADVVEGVIEPAQVMARFVKCSDPEVLGNIVRYNNTQNKVEATDFRSKDSTQERLRTEFDSIPDAEYRGGRRGGVSDAIVRKKSVLPDSTVAQALAAFHLDPNLAYNETRTIWDNDRTYASVFRETLGARHVVYAYSLLKAVEAAKQRIVRIDEASRTEAQKKHAKFFSARGSNYLLVAAISKSIETILGCAVPDRYALRFKKNISPSDASAIWTPLVEILLAFSTQLQSGTDQGLKAKDKVATAIDSFASMVEATRSGNPNPFDSLANATEATGSGSLG